MASREMPKTLRLITDTLYQSVGRQTGMSPTRAFLDGILKYKSTMSERDNPKNHFFYTIFSERIEIFAHSADSSLVGVHSDGGV